MFGDDNYTPPPPLPPPPPSAPQFASGIARPTRQGKPFGGTLLTSPLGGADNTNVARKSLVTS